MGSSNSRTLSNSLPQDALIPRRAIIGLWLRQTILCANTSMNVGCAEVRGFPRMSAIVMEMCWTNVVCVVGKAFHQNFAIAKKTSQTL